MFKSYFVIAWRSLIKNRTFYFINILGLSIGLTCCLLISAYLYTELTYDTYPQQADQIYRVGINVNGNGATDGYPHVDFAVGRGMKNAFGEVADFTRFIRAKQLYLRYKETVFKEQHMAMADSNFLRFFSIQLIEGNDKTALREPNSIVVTKAFAQKYFGEESPLGKVLSFGQDGEYKVTGMISEVPDKSHFHFDAFISMSGLRFDRETWSNVGVYTYLRLNEHTDPVTLQAKFPQLVEKYVVPEVQQDMGISLAEAQKSVNTFIFTLQPLRDIHLYSHSAYELEPNGDIKYVYIFGALAIFILLLACVNFINLSTAASAKRSREVGIRKVMGSLRMQLIIQFLTESVLLSFCAMFVAYGIVSILLPYFHQLTGIAIGFDFFLQPVTVAIVLFSLVAVGMLAGIYPAFFLSSFKTLRVLKANSGSADGKRNSLRSGLVVFQFAVSTALIVATLVIYQQLSFMQNKNLGYNKEQVMVIEDSYLLRNNESVLKEKLLRNSRVTNVSIARNIPGAPPDGTQAFAKQNLESESHDEIHIDIFRIDYDFVPTLGIALKEGRNLSPDFPSDSSGIVINETAARAFGWTTDEALNKTIVTSGQNEFHVVGVVKDFNYASVREKIGPLVMMLPRHNGITLVKFQAADVQEVIAFAREQWNAFNPDAPFAYSFLDQRFSAMYFSEERTGKVFTIFAVIAIAIAALGLFGLSAYTAAQRTKEIGIRKVLGASATEVLIMLSKQFLILVVIAFIIAVPVVAWTMNQWLEDFAYRIALQWWVFALAGVSVVAIAFASMLFQTMKAAVANPVKSLRSE